MNRILASSAPSATVLVRLVAGCVFLSEGIQKFVFPVEQGAGRFAKIGIPAPQFFGPFVGAAETVCGLLLILGLLTRLAAIPLIVDMIVAISTTKIPMWANKGFWAMAHEARTDWSMLLSSLFLLIVGAGAYSLDQRILNAKASRPQS